VARARPSGMERTEATVSRCRHQEWLEKFQHRRWSYDCLDIVAPGGQPVSHVHGTWTGWTEDDLRWLTIELSAPWGPHQIGDTLLVAPHVLLWRPHSRTYVYRPRQWMASLPDQIQEWLARHPEWDTDSVALPGTAAVN
jgi:hypothetical protein